MCRKHWNEHAKELKKKKKRNVIEEVKAPEIEYEMVMF